MPTTIINQNQQQSQSVQVQILLEVQSKIDEKLYGLEKGSKERTFLEKIKSSLSTVRTIGELLALIFGLSKDSGLDIDTLADLFK